MRASLKGIGSHELLAVAVIGGEAAHRQVEHELDLRAAGALVSRIVGGAEKADRPASRRTAAR